jgi:hypothetical protein
LVGVLVGSVVDVGVAEGETELDGVAVVVGAWVGVGVEVADGVGDVEGSVGLRKLYAP